MVRKAAVALCTPPDVRLEMCLAAIAAGRDLLIEKPPAATLGEIETIIDAAQAAGVTLFATWHSRFAPGVARGARLDRRAAGSTAVTITWREDVRRWHPGQAWIWQPGGFGVFDPGINALSILTEILPGADPCRCRRTGGAVQRLHPDRRAPVDDRRADACPITADFDWRQEGPQTWEIMVETEGRRLLLAQGGAVLTIDGGGVNAGPEAEYPRIYQRFAKLIATRQSDADIVPLRLVADACLKGRQIRVAPFSA